ncbi:MAG: hypothetical protein E7Z68_01935 [Thermoplasmata archaeon]|nr:hypothetical protein [Thermoplasmata archaeon]
MERSLCYKVGTCIPRAHLERLMDEVTSSISPLYPGYDRCFSYWPVMGTWRPLEGSDPFIGTPGRIEAVEETRVEFAVKEEDLRKAVEAVRRAHPYEEPAIDVIPMIPWKDLTASDDTNRCCRRSSASCGS